MRKVSLEWNSVVLLTNLLHWIDPSSCFGPDDPEYRVIHPAAWIVGDDSDTLADR